MDRTLDGPNKSARHFRSESLQRTSFSVFVRPAKRSEIRARRRVAARKEEEQQDADAVDVGLDRWTAGARQHLRREVQRRAGEIDRRGFAAIAAGPEVHQDHAAVAGHHHVLCLDVAVEQPRRVHRCDSTAERMPYRRDLPRCESPPIVDDQLMQRATVDVFRPQPHAIVDPLSAVDGDDVGMPDPGKQPTLFDDGRGELVGR